MSGHPTAQTAERPGEAPAPSGTGGPPAPAGHLYVNFFCYRLDPAFRRLEAGARKRAVQEFLNAAQPYDKPLQLRWHVSTGLRADVDLLIWAFSTDLATFQRFAAEIAQTGLGQYLVPSHTFLALRKTSQYTSHHATAFEAGLPPYKYLFLYPFVKSREWYLLPFAERRRMMEQHAATGAKYPSVRLNTTYSFGLGDQDFVLAFEAEEAADFEDLVQKLRESEASRYTVRDTPMIVAAFVPSAADAVRGLGV